MAPTDPSDDEVMAAELALGLLDGQERATALRRLLAEPDFARRFSQWRAHFASWLDELPDVAPPAYREPAGVALMAEKRPANGWRTAAIATLAACACLLVLLLRPQAVPPSTARTPVLVATLSGSDRPPFAILYDPAARTITVPVELAVDPGRTLQLWAIGEDGVPHSLGVLRPSARFTRVVRAEEAAFLRSGETLAISVEPIGGSPRETPTGPVVATGRLVTA